MALDGVQLGDHRPVPGKAPIRIGSRQKRGSIGLSRLKGEDFELVHPRGVKEVELDYQEGIEIWKAGDPESARDALRYALSACHDNLWVHVALGQIALQEFRDPTLGSRPLRLCVRAGSTVLCPRVSRAGYRGTDRTTARFMRPSTVWFRCLEALGQTHDCARLRALARSAVGRLRLERRSADEALDGL